MAFARGHAFEKALRISRIKHTRKFFSQFFSSSLLVMLLLWCWAASSLPTLLLDVHEEKGEWDLWTIAVVKPAREATIRFLGNTSARLLGVIRLWFVLPRGRSGSSTLMVCFIYFALIIQAPTKPRGEPKIPLVAMGWIHLMFLLVLLNIHDIWLKLKSGFRIIHKFPTDRSQIGLIGLLKCEISLNAQFYGLTITTRKIVIWCALSKAVHLKPLPDHISIVVHNSYSVLTIPWPAFFFAVRISGRDSF
jgi:hypothetical protein